ASERLMEMARSKPKDYQFAVFHKPNGKFPATAAKSLGFTEEQFKTGLLAPRIGNTYSAAVLLGLCNILDVAKPGDRIFMCGYGSGAGADAFDLTVTKNIDSYDRGDPERLETKRDGHRQPEPRNPRSARNGASRFVAFVLFVVRRGGRLMARKEVPKRR